MSPPAEPSWTPANAPFVPIARRIVQRIAALGATVPQLAGFGGAGLYIHEDWGMNGYQLFGRVMHESPTHPVPNPAYDPARPESPIPQYLPVRDPVTGYGVDMYFYTGPWMSLNPAQPVSIGRLNIVVQVSAADRALGDRLQRAIDQVIASERAAFERR
jgi:hypothetical protein